MFRGGACFLILLIGCIPPSDPFPIPEQIHIACPKGTDAWITSWLAFIEADRQAGYTYSEEIYYFTDFCSDYDIECNACYTAMVNHVYSVSP